MKRSLSVSLFQLVYGTKAIFPSQPTLLVERFFQYHQGEPDDMMRRVQVGQSASGKRADPG
jgi:hypothetical protein